MGARFSYRVYLTPRTGRSTYGSEIEITSRVTEIGLPNFGRSIDSTDYGIGVYTYGDLRLVCANSDGYFNDQNDHRSVFDYSRDLAKVRIVFESAIVTRDAAGSVSSSTVTSTTTFKGTVSDEATKVDPKKETTSFRVLSIDSVFKNARIPSGAIPSGTDSTTALRTALGQYPIPQVLGVDQANINPDFEFTIDNGFALDNQASDNVIRQLILATNSVLLINESDDVIVRSRDADDTLSTLYLYGPFTGRGNILELNSYNDGRQRLFTSIKVNDSESFDSGYIKDFGFRQKGIELSFIMDSEVAGDIAARLVSEFRILRPELEVTVSAETAEGVGLLQPVSIDFPYNVKPYPNDAALFMPILGQAEIDDATTPLPFERGAIKIEPNVKWKVMEIEENPKEFTVTLKLRQDGNAWGGGYF